MADNIVFRHRFSSAKRVVHSKILWSQLPDEVIESILKWLPYESLVRFRTVCKDWNNLLSAQHFLSWRRENFKENPWLLIVNNRSDCYRLNVSTKEAKAFPVNYKVLGSVGGLVLHGSSLGELFLCNPFTRKNIQINSRFLSTLRKILVCNLARETFVELPVPMLSKENGILVGDILWKGNRYQVVALQRNFIEVYDFSKRSWVIVQQLPEQIIIDIIFFKGLYFCTVRSSSNDYRDCECSVKVLKIKEDCTWEMVHQYLSLAVYRMCSVRMPPQLVVCGSALFLITKGYGLCLRELEYDNNLSITSNLSWKAIARMPRKVLKFLSGRHSCIFCKSIPTGNNFCFQCRYLAIGNNICFLNIMSGKLAFFNKENGSWSSLSLDDIGENYTIFFDEYLYDPRPDISFQ